MHVWTGISKHFRVSKKKKEKNAQIRWLNMCATPLIFSFLFEIQRAKKMPSLISYELRIFS